MSESLWTAQVLEGIRARLASRLADVLVLIQADGGSAVSAPVSFEVRENLDGVNALPGVMVSTGGEVESELLMPSSYRLRVPLRVTSIVSPESGPNMGEAARTYNRGVINVLTETDTVTDVTGLFYVGEVQSRIEQSGEGTRKWRRLGVVDAILFVATTRELS